MCAVLYFSIAEINWDMPIFLKYSSFSLVSDNELGTSTGPRTLQKTVEIASAATW